MSTARHAVQWDWEALPSTQALRAVDTRPRTLPSPRCLGWSRPADPGKLGVPAQQPGTSGLQMLRASGELLGDWV